jgi:hypothetical protein
MDEMGGACSINRDMKCMQVLFGNLNRKDYLLDLCTDRRIILKAISEN